MSKTQRGLEREVVIMMTDMIQYSQQSQSMTPEEIKNFLIEYHSSIYQILHQDDSLPIELEPSAGDGCLIIFDKRSGEDRSGVCNRALQAALRLAAAIEAGLLPATRMGILLGRITEAMLGTRMAKFGTSFAVANRLEELCGHFGTNLLMDREVARYQQNYDDYLVNIAKVSLTSVLHPMNIFSLYISGVNNCPASVSEDEIRTFIRRKNRAMEFFSGNRLTGVEPDFPRVREELIDVQNYYREITGMDDKATDRILEYIRETPSPGLDFRRKGMLLLEKKRDSLGERLFHLSKQLLKAMNPDFYHALVVDTAWERMFKLEWRKKGEVIILIDTKPDGIYYLDTGEADTLNRDNKLLSTMEAGAIFGEMAYFGKQRRRTATVIAKTDVVLRRISTEDFSNLPIIIQIFERIAKSRQQEIQRKESEQKKASQPPR